MKSQRKKSQRKKSQRLTDQTDDPRILFEYYSSIARDPKRTAQERERARHDAMDVWSWMPWHLTTAPHIEQSL
jgi:hypothetical protein